MASGADLLEKMRRSPHGHSPRDFARLLGHFGFKRLEKTNHTVYRHELLAPGVVVTVPRHRPVKSYVARQAVSAVDSVVTVLRDRDQQDKHDESGKDS